MSGNKIAVLNHLRTKYPQLAALLWIAVITAFTSLAGCGDKDPSPKPPPPPVDVEVGKAAYWVTTGDQTRLLHRENDLSVISEKETTLPLISIDPEERYQRIEGFGAALTGSSAYLINQKLNASQRQALLQDLFNPESGIGITALRLTIGASDFSLEDYTYNDLPAGETDYELQKFSLDYERTDLLPLLSQIGDIAPDVTIIASPWTAPAWMKSNGSLHGGSLKAEAYDVYANYFVRYITGMNEEGIVIDAVTIQNEPLHTAGYPSMRMTAEEQNTFIKSHLGPAFSEASLDTKIILYDHNWDNTQYAISILNDPETKALVEGTAFHAYAGNVSAMSVVRNAHPDKGLYFTEISGGGWATDFSSNLQWNMANIFIGTTKNWSRTALLWNLSLDENSGPTNNGCMDCRGVVTINSNTGAITRNVEYYSIGHFSKFVRNGAHRIGSTMTPAVSGIDHVAFINPDQSRVVVLSNAGSSQQNVVVSDGDRQFTFLLPAASVVTVVWE